VSQPKRYSIRGFSAALVEEDNGVMVKWEDYAALKAETVRQIETALPSLEAYIGKLEAEVDRLTKERDHYQWASTNDGIACNERARENQDLENQIAELKAENERLLGQVECYIATLDRELVLNLRLVKAGDALLECHKIRDDLAYSIQEQSPDVAKAMLAWLAAKETQP